MDGQPKWEVGGGGRPARWKGLYLAAGVAIVVAAVVVAATAPIGARTDRSLVVDAAPSVTSTAEGAITWSPLERSTGTTLSLAYAAGPVHLLDVDRGKVIEEVPVELTVSDVPDLLVARVGSATVVQARDDVTYVFGPRLPLRRLGRSWWFLPASRDLVWLIDGTSLQPGAGLRVRLVDLTGAEVLPLTAVPADQRPIAGRHDRLLLKDIGVLRWWNPHTGATQSTPRDVLAVSAGVTVVCRDRCHTVDVLDPSGRRRERLHTQHRVLAAVLAPEDRAVALLTDAANTTAASLLIADLAGRAVHTVADGAALVSRRLLTWSPNGAFVFFATVDGTLGVFDRASHTLHRVDVDLSEVDAMAAFDGP